MNVEQKYKTLLAHIYEAKREPLGGWNLAAMNILLEELDHPERAYQTIHVAGTNGKGSVTNKICACLIKAGLCCGMYTSPHLFSYRERIVVNGEKISKEDLLFHSDEVLNKACSLKISLSFFELSTIVAFLYFRRLKVDVAVVEAGLGGRLDATNVLSPLLSVITTIDYDHMDMLGDTLEKIAAEKSGIIKPNSALVIGPKADVYPIREKCKSLGVPLHKVEDCSDNFELENKKIAEESWKYIADKLNLSFEAGLEGLDYKPRCRFEIVRSLNLTSIPYVICDVAHNPFGFEALAKRMQKELCEKQFCFLMAFTGNKDVSSMLASFSLFKQSYFVFTEVPTKRTMPLDNVKRHLKSGLKGYSFFEKNCEDGIKKAIKQAQEKKLPLCVCGSFFLFDPFFTFLSKLDFAKF